MNYGIVNLNEKIVAGYCNKTSNLSPNMGQVIGELWRKFYSDEGYFNIPDKLNKKSLGIYTDYESCEKGEYTAMVACEVENADITDKFIVRKIPAGKYAKFIVRGNTITAVREFWEKLWKMNLERSFICDFEEYQNSDFENAEIHIYISIK